MSKRVVIAVCLSFILILSLSIVSAESSLDCTNKVCDAGEVCRAGECLSYPIIRDTCSAENEGAIRCMFNHDSSLPEGEQYGWWREKCFFIFDGDEETFGYFWIFDENCPYHYSDSCQEGICVSPIITLPPITIICAEQGDRFYFTSEDDSLPTECCEGLDSIFLIGGISVADECYWTGELSESSWGLCSDCGNGICEDIESVCYCPEDCVGKGKSDYNTIKEFCESESYVSYCIEGSAKELNLELCSLCGKQFQEELEEQIFELEEGETDCGAGSWCFLYDKCYPRGYRTSRSYCFNEEFVQQKSDGEMCNKNFECRSNLCINHECIKQSLFARIINWFKNCFR